MITLLLYKYSVYILLPQGIYITLTTIHLETMGVVSMAEDFIAEIERELMRQEAPEDYYDEELDATGKHVFEVWFERGYEDAF